MFSVYFNNIIAYTTKYEDPEYIINSPIISKKIGKAGSFTFYIYPNHPLYDSLIELVTVVTIYENSKLIFRGRVLSITNDFYNQKSVYCEGDLSFLIDSYQPPFEGEESPKETLQRLITNHNTQIESYKQFSIGEVTIDDADKKRKYEMSSYSKTMDCIDDLISEFGGYFNTRVSGETIFLDWIKEYKTETDQIIEFGRNLLDIENEFITDDAFTILVPIGNDNMDISSVNNGKPYIEINEGINTRGRIYKIKEFYSAENPQDLLNKGQKFVTDNFERTPSEIKIRAIDLSIIAPNIKRISIGDKARLKTAPHKIDRSYICTEIEKNITSPENTVYIFGDPKQELDQDRTFTEHYSSDIDKAISTGNKAGSLASETRSKLEDYIRATDDTLILHAENIELNARNITANAEAIALRATKEDMEAELKIVHDEISARVTNEDFEAYVTIAADQIQSKVSSEEFTSYITQTDQKIESKVSSEDFSTYVTQTDKELTLKANQTTVDALTNRVTNAESSIKVNADSIETKVSKNGVISSINQTAESVKIQASKIELSGYVTASQLSAELANFQLTMNQNIVTNNLSVNGHAYLPSYVTISSHALSLDSMDVVTSVGRTKRYAMGPSGTTIEIYECSSVRKESINFVSWS